MKKKRPYDYDFEFAQDNEAFLYGPQSEPHRLRQQNSIDKSKGNKNKKSVTSEGNTAENDEI